MRHVGKLVVMYVAIADIVGGCLGGGMSVLTSVASSGVWVAVYPGVPGELVRSAEALGAAGELADVRLLAGVGSDVSRLVLEAMEGLVAQGTFVGTRQIRA